MNDAILIIDELEDIKEMPTEFDPFFEKTGLKVNFTKKKTIRVELNFK